MEDTAVEPPSPDQTTRLGRVNGINPHGVISGILPLVPEGDDTVKIVVQSRPPIPVGRKHPDKDRGEHDGRTFYYPLTKAAQPGDLVRVYYGNHTEVMPGWGAQLFRPELQTREALATSERPADNPAPITGASAMDRQKIQDMIATEAAKTDTKFAKLEGKIDVMLAEMRASNANITGLRTTVIVTGIGLFFSLAALGFAMANFASSSFSQGMTLRTYIESIINQQKPPPPKQP